MNSKPTASKSSRPAKSIDERLDDATVILRYSGPLAFIPINKNGSNTITRALRKRYGVPLVLRRGEAVSLKETGCPIYVMWREPHERMESLYRWRRARGDILLNVTFSDFVQKWILEPPRFDQHVCPQYIFCRAKKHIWLPTHIVRWDWAKVEDVLDLKFITHENKSEPADTRWRPDVRKLFDENYELDIAVWHGCDNPYAE